MLEYSKSQSSWNQNKPRVRLCGQGLDEQHIVHHDATIPFLDPYWKWLIIGTVPANKNYVTGTVKKRLSSKEILHSHGPLGDADAPPPTVPVT